MTFYQNYEVIKHTEINEIVFYVSDFVHKLSHIHPDMELDLVLEGDFLVRTNDELYEAHAGSLMVFNPFKPHEFMSKSGRCRIFVPFHKKTASAVLSG